MEAEPARRAEEEGNPVNTYTIHVDSHEGLATEEGLDAVHRKLMASKMALDAAVGIDAADAYSATFQVTAKTAGSAAMTAAIAFNNALSAAGLRDEAIAHLEVVDAGAVAA